MGVLLRIEGNFPCVRAIVAHLVGNLPFGTTDHFSMEKALYGFPFVL